MYRGQDTGAACWPRGRHPGPPGLASPGGFIGGAQAAPGGIGLNTLLAVSLELYHNGHPSLLEVLKLVTSAPAGLMGLPAGSLKEGAPADLVLFDPDTVKDLATFENPHVPSQGIEKVWVNGQLVIEGGRITGKRIDRIHFVEGHLSPNVGVPIHLKRRAPVH